MKLIQVPKNLSFKNSLMRVDTDTYAELLEREMFGYRFNITLKLALSNNKKRIQDYDRVVVTIKKKESEKLALTSLGSNIIKNASVKTNNGIDTVTKNFKLLKPNNGIPTAKLPDKLASKVYSGLQMLQDLNETEEYVDRKEISIGSIVDETTSNMFTVTEMFSPALKSDIFENRIKRLRQERYPLTNLQFERLPLEEVDPSRLDPNDVIERINLELVDLTEPVTEESTSRLTNTSYLDSVKKRMQNVANGKSPLYYDIVKYFMDKIPDSPREDEMKQYHTRQVTKMLSEVEVSEIFFIPVNNSGLNLTVRFDLYKKDTNVLDETFTTNLSMPEHIEAYESVKNPPSIRVSAVPKVDTRTGITTNAHLLVIDRPPRLEKEKISGYNVYLKTINRLGNVFPYRKLGFIDVDKSAPFLFTSNTDLSVLRVVPVDQQNKESNVYTNKVIGPGHKVIGNLTILPSHFGKNNRIRIDVANIPKDSISLTLWRRDCTDNPDASFYPHDYMKGQRSNSNAVFIDKKVKMNRVYEYYVVSIGASKKRSDNYAIVSNYAMFKNNPSVSETKAIDVTISEPTVQKLGNSLSLTFNIVTRVSPTENERITQSLKTQLSELYEQFLNPASNASSPLGDKKGVPEFRDLFYHEVVRTNMNTGERETFDLVVDGPFEDSPRTQRVLNIKPVNPEYAYTYQVFTFKKNPIELFKKYIARGVDTRGKEWFYLPYKWLNPKAKIGSLYPDDNDGTPIIDAYESFTSEAYGLTATYRLMGSTQYTSLSQVTPDRIDRNTIKITWEIEGLAEVNNESLYDSFVVMKVVNGKRSFVGRTSKNYIYHEIEKDDIGTVYYIVVPIMMEFDIDEPAYSSEIVISPDGLTEKVKTPLDSLTLKNNISVPKVSDLFVEVDEDKRSRLKTLRKNLRDEKEEIEDNRDDDSSSRRSPR